MDVWITRIILVAIGLFLLIGGIGAVLLAAMERPIPPILSGMVGTALGALTAYLMPMSKTIVVPNATNERRT